MAAVVLAVFLPAALFCGLYLDDYSFFAVLEGASLGRLWTAFLHYVPGRNLHILFFSALLRLTGGSVSALHAISIGFDALNAILVYRLARRLSGLRAVAFASALIFALASNHGETHFWINNLPQCQIPVSLVLSAFLLALRPNRLFAAAAVYALALFTYDQVFFLWPLLLAAAWRADARPRPRLYAAATGTLLGFNAVHVALRYLSPYSDGGRPLIRVQDVLRRCYDAAFSTAKGLLPVPTPSYLHWAWTIPLTAVALATAVWLVNRARQEARAQAKELTHWARSSGSIETAIFGAAWSVLGYAPNLFWYISPRHSLLPSVGWAIASCALAAIAAARWKKAAKALPACGVLFLAASAVFDVHEGTQWVASRRLHDDFDAELRRLTSGIDSLFLVGAPRYLRRAPAFNLPHDVGLAAGRALKRPAPTSFHNATPTRRGILYDNDLSIAPADIFHWIPAERARIVSYDPVGRSFSCPSTLELELPDGSMEKLALPPDAACIGTLRLPLQAALVSSHRSARPPTPPHASVAAGLELISVAAAVHGNATRLTFEWNVNDPPHVPIALVPRVQNVDTIFPSNGQRRNYPLLWPLVDDLAPTLSLRRGDVLKQTFDVRRILPLDGALLEADVFELPPGQLPRRQARIAAPVARIR